VEYIDSVSKEDAFRLIENAVIKQEFGIDIFLEQLSTTLTFTANNIYPSSLNAVSGSPNGINNGTCNELEFINVLIK
jgi:hypothetical protein